MAYIPTVRELLEGGDIRGRRLAANQKGRRSVEPPSATRASGRSAPVLDGATPSQPASEDAWDIRLLSGADLRRIVKLLRTELAHEPPVLALSIAEAARCVSVHPDTLANAIKRGELVARRVGRRVLIEVAELRKWLESRPKAGGTSHGA